MVLIFYYSCTWGWLHVVEIFMMLFSDVSFMKTVFMHVLRKWWRDILNYVEWLIHLYDLLQWGFTSVTSIKYNRYIRATYYWFISISTTLPSCSACSASCRQFINLVVESISLTISLIWQNSSKCTSVSTSSFYFLFFYFLFL